MSRVDPDRIDAAFQADGFFRQAKTDAWKTMNAYTHSGLPQLVRQFSGIKVAASYSEPDVLEGLRALQHRVAGYLLAKSTGRNDATAQVDGFLIGPLMNGNAHRNNFPSCQPAVLFLRVAKNRAEACSTYRAVGFLPRTSRTRKSVLHPAKNCMFTIIGLSGLATAVRMCPGGPSGLKAVSHCQEPVVIPGAVSDETPQGPEHVFIPGDRRIYRGRNESRSSQAPGNIGADSPLKTARGYARPCVSENRSSSEARCTSPERYPRRRSAL